MDSSCQINGLGIPGPGWILERFSPENLLPCGRPALVNEERFPIWPQRANVIPVWRDPRRPKAGRSGECSDRSPQWIEEVDAHQLRGFPVE